MTANSESLELVAFSFHYAFRTLFPHTAPVHPLENDPSGESAGESQDTKNTYLSTV